jgi:NADH pyrophosphatase NudC (nudix superfamily)
MPYSTNCLSVLPCFALLSCALSYPILLYMYIYINIIEFHRSHKFCSRCGHGTVSAKAGGCRQCMNDNCSRRGSTRVYPRIDTATIMLITSSCGEYALLGRKRAWPSGRYSTLAGFTEVGETLEHCVVREVREESGIRVDLNSVAFVASQPWPFPRYVCSATAHVLKCCSL